jgi:predicted transcriptional regulator YdeE
MNPVMVDESGFVVIGVAARTSNAREMTGKGIIGEQWGRFLQENLLSQIPNKMDSAIVAVYTDYASDQDAEYTFVIGARVRAGTEAPTDMVATTVPAVFGTVVLPTDAGSFDCVRLAPHFAQDDRALKEV